MADELNIAQPQQLRAAADGFFQQAEQARELLQRCYTASKPIDEQGWAGNRAAIWAAILDEVRSHSVAVAGLAEEFGGFLRDLANKIESGG